MNHSTRVRLRACALLLLAAFAARAQVRGGWERVEQCSPAREGGRGISYVQFFDNKEGLIAGDAGFIRYTRNGGVTWREPKLPRALTVGGASFGEDILAGSRHPGGRRGGTVYLVTGRRLLKSTDRGATWETMKQPLPPRRVSADHGPGLIIEYYDVAFVSEKEGWVLCGVLKKVNNKDKFLQSYVLWTDDGGDTWEETQLEPRGLLMVRMHFADRKNGWVVGENGTILHTDDGGENWNPQPYHVPEGAKTVSSRPKLLDVHFKGKENGIIVGKQGTILKTEDGGRNWFSMRPPDAQGKPERRDLIRVQMAGDAHAWIVGEAGIIFSTENGGQTWSRDDALAKENLYAIFMHDRKHGWATGDKRTVLRFDVDDDPSELRRASDDREDPSGSEARPRARKTRHE